MTHGTNINSSYQVRVQAVTGLVAGDWTESAVFHPALPPTAPYWVKAQRTGASQVTATWNGVSNAATFNVEYSEDNGANWTSGQTGVTGTSATLSLAVGKSYVVRVQGVNSHGVGAWQNSPALNSPYLSTAGIFQSTARVNIFNYSGSWYYKANVGPHSSCQGPVSTIHTTFSGLADSTTYTYTAYADSACNGGALTPAITFTTLNPPVWLTVTNVGDTTATLNMTQYPNKWWYAQVGDPSNFQCVEGPGPRSSVNVTGLTKNTRYTYITYSAPQCLVVSIIDRAYFSTTDAGAGNLNPTLDGGCRFGRPDGDLQSCAASFTTGGNTGGGYFLHDVTVQMDGDGSNVGSLSVAVHAGDGSGNPAAAPLTTLSGTTQSSAGAYTFTCASACYLYKNTTYFVVVSAPNASFRRQPGDWMTRNSGYEYAWPANGGWAIGNGAKQKSGANAWTNLSSGQTPVLHVAANATDATLSVSGVIGGGREPGHLRAHRQLVLRRRRRAAYVLLHRPVGEQHGLPVRPVPQHDLRLYGLQRQRVRHPHRGGALHHPYHHPHRLGGYDDQRHADPQRTQRSLALPGQRGPAYRLHPRADQRHGNCLPGRADARHGVHLLGIRQTAVAPRGPS